MMEEAYKAKEYPRLMTLADSLEKTGDLLSSKANYWRGYASNRMKRNEDAVTFWKTSVDIAAESDAEEEIDTYVKSATRLADYFCVKGDYEGALKLALPVIERLESLKCDTTSDYVNLLIYVGLSQIGLGQAEKESHQGFLKACEKHRQNIDQTHSDEAYKNAIAGLVNIAYYCVQAKEYEPALYYTRHFGELLIEYEQRPGVDSFYIDRQVGRFTIYKALALHNLGRQEEANKTYEAFKATKFSKSREGEALASNYQDGRLETEEAEMP